MRKRIKWLITAAVLLVAAGAGCYNLLRTPAAEEGAGGLFLDFDHLVIDAAEADGFAADGPDEVDS